MTLFTNTDFRASLSWRGRFAGIANAVNCYSETEDVLQNPEMHGYGGAWSMQELLKGTAAWNALNAVPYYGRDVDCEGGWGVNTFYAVNPALYTPGYGFHSSAMADITRQDAIEHPLFTPFRSEADAMHVTNLFTIADQSYRAALRAKFLGDAIPATSFATGRNRVMAWDHDRNVDYWRCKRPGLWARGSDEWLHSDIKNIAYYFQFELFRRIVNNEGGENDEEGDN